MTNTMVFAASASEGEKVVGPVARALGVIERVGALRIASVMQLSVETGLPKPTIIRLLRTLTICGYVRQVSSRSGYCLTSKLRTIGAGFDGVAAFLEAGRGPADMLTGLIKWPVSLATIDGSATVVRYSTIPSSPYAHARSTVGKRLPIATSAHGKALLAHLPFAERHMMLETVNADVNAAGIDEGACQSIRDRGFAARTLGRDPSTNTIAAPILLGDEVVGTIGITFFSSVVRPDMFPALGARLMQSAAMIASRLP